ncbi:MAG TPA: fibronectin type III domain-containing protein [Chitinophagaceae bacterium]
MSTRTFKGYLPLFYALSILSFSLIACSKSSEENQAPQAFTVSVTNTTINSATLNWTEAKDPENAAVSYAIELNNQVVAAAITNTTYNLQNLSVATSYNGKITASDPAGNKTTASFSFSTNDTPIPSDFTVKMDSAWNKSIFISWTASTLPNNVTVSYDVYVNGTIKAGSIVETKYAITGLSPNTDYQVKVIAKSPDGKSREKQATYKTKDNTAPSAFTISEVKHGFSYVSITGTQVTDADNDVLTWFLVKNNVEAAIPSIPNTASTFSYIAKALNENAANTVAIRVKDPYGAIVTSNTLSTTTYKLPGNPVIAVTEENNKVIVQWINNTLDQFDVSNSIYYIAGVANMMTSGLVTTTVNPDNTTSVKLSLDPTAFTVGVAQTIKVSLNWGDANSNFITSSNTISYTRNLYTPTTATVSTALIKGPGTFPPQFFINFTNCVISEYPTWQIEELKFDNVTIFNFVGFAICDPLKVGYYTGNVTGDQYIYLKTKTNGYIVVKDAGGFHKINFTYTTQD